MQENNPYESPNFNMSDVIEEGIDLSSYSLKELNRMYYYSIILGVGSTLMLFPLIVVAIIDFALIAPLNNSSEVILPILIMCLISYVVVMAFLGGFRRGRQGQICMAIVSAFSLIIFPIGTILGMLFLLIIVASGKMFGEGRIKHSDITKAIAVKEAETKPPRVSHGI